MKSVTNPTEISNAAPELIAHAFGLREDAPHPLTGRPFESAMRLSTVAAACGLRVRPQLDHELDRSVVARGMHSEYFQNALAESVRTLIRRNFDVGARHRVFTSIVECQDFREQDLPGEPDSFGLDEIGTELSEISSRPVQLSIGARSAKLRSFGRILEISRKLLLDDQVALVSGLLAKTGTAAARLEARLVFESLESNGNLDDNGPVFHGDYGNVLAEAFDAEKFGQAVALLAKQADGESDVGDMQPAHLVVSADLAVAASKVLREVGLDQAVWVTATARLPPARWYVMADPEQHPVVGVLRLTGSTASVSITPRTKSLNDSVAFRITLDTEAVMLGRTGIVRGGA